ncbi:ATP-dependent DNA ligase [Amycolatopsis rubida]|uniref:DNA ligase (ATP) n=1 Tax=Amycolatopsis rubida TaxID=112413 RepID=A0A1I5QK37_9PSEU|nr:MULTISPECIES: ATP-dependent DNA ligase [Amycolatopsis]MYW96600.1 ATP-dependent DNA ligase [Amycolatopsis rubida]NEC61585.1 ATP-dependent DNA ligase [Amycolatopsis rubida]OAP26576.1 putative DNA ligase-like protein [Amycolatopsis sp. M39]SFP46430.1 ATP-dependent DNA ligase [Amycolatopsis rubida]
MALPVQAPIKPMLAKPAKAIPDSGGLLFEPKWDGFRCLVFRDGDDITLQSRAEKPLNRYFPEVLAALRESLPERVVLDGELVVARDGKLDFDALTERIHPADSRVQLLAEQSPAQFVAFDVLALGDESFVDEPTSARRERLESLPGVALTPATTDPETARRWFELFEGAGLDGVIGKPLDEPYSPGKRVLFKYKHSRTADCVLAGLRWHVDGEPGEAVGSFLLGLYDETGLLHHVGVVGSFPVARRRELAQELAPLITDGEGHPWLGDAVREGQRIPGGITRWRSKEQPWVPLRLERVVEVSYEHTEGGYPSRFRHTAQFARWRPDREPSSCGYSQLDEPARYDLSAVFRGEVVRTR